MKTTTLLLAFFVMACGAAEAPSTPSACLEAAALFCDTACACTGDGTCRYQGYEPAGNQGVPRVRFQNRAACLEAVSQSYGCTADASRVPASCLDSLPSAVCTAATDGQGSFAAVPPACNPDCVLGLFACPS